MKKILVILVGFFLLVNFTSALSLASLDMMKEMRDKEEKVLIRQGGGKNLKKLIDKKINSFEKNSKELYDFSEKAGKIYAKYPEHKKLHNALDYIIASTGVENYDFNTQKALDDWNKMNGINN